MARPGDPLDRRQRRLLRFVPGPMVRPEGRCVGRGGPRSAFVDPTCQQGDLGGVERLAFAVGRHRQLGVLAVDGSQQPAGLRIAGHQRPLTRVAAGERRLPRMQPQAAFLFRRSVAALAMGRENWPHVAREVDRCRLRLRRRRIVCTTRASAIHVAPNAVNKMTSSRIRSWLGGEGCFVAARNSRPACPSARGVLA